MSGVNRLTEKQNLNAVCFPLFPTTPFPRPHQARIPNARHARTLSHFPCLPNSPQKRLFSGVGGDKGLALLNVLLEVAKARLKELLLSRVDRTDGQNLGNTLGPELDLGAEELNALVLVQRAVDKRRLDHALLAAGRAQHAVSHPRARHRHAQRRRPRAVLGLDHLVAAKLHAVDEGRVRRQVGVRRLAEQRHDGDTRVPADHGDVLVRRVGSLDLGHEARRAHHVERGDAEQALGVVHAARLEHLGDDGDGRVDGVADDEDVGVGARLGARLGQVAHDAGVGVEQVVARHAGLAGDAGGDQDDFGVLERAGEAGGGRVVALDRGLGVDVRDVGGDAWTRD